MKNRNKESGSDPISHGKVTPGPFVSVLELYDCLIERIFFFRYN